jgi:hypothetical protein
MISAATVHLATNDAVDRTLYNFTAASTPGSSERIVAAVLAARVGSDPPTPAVAAFGIVLTFRRVVNIGANTALHLFEASAAGAAGTAVSIDFGVATIDHCSCIIASHDSALPIIQHVAASTGGALFVQASLAALTPGSGVGMFAYTFGVAAAYDHEAGYTEAADIAAATGNSRLAYEWRADTADTTPRYSTAGSTTQIAVAFEIGSVSQASATMAGVASFTAGASVRASLIDVIAGVETELPSATLLPDALDVALYTPPSVEIVPDNLEVEVL